MKVIIAGAGSVGRYMAGQLVEGGHEVTLIDQDPTVVGRHAALAAAGVRWAQGDGCEIDTLAHSGAAEADVVAAVTGDDEDNLVISLLAKQEFGVPAWSRASTIRTTSGCSTTCGVSTCRSRPRTSSPDWWKRP